jgi:esterase/lipase superfamily enzyme
VTADDFQKFRMSLSSAVWTSAEETRRILRSREFGEFLRDCDGVLGESAWQFGRAEFDSIKLLSEAGLKFKRDHASQIDPPLIRVVKSNQEPAIVEWLLEHGEAVNEKNSYGATALEVAYELGFDNLRETLRLRGGTGNIDSDRELRRAIRQKNFAAVAQLRDLGASPWSNGGSGNSAYEIAFNYAFAARLSSDSARTTDAVCLLALLLEDGRDVPKTEIPSVAALAALLGHDALVAIVRSLISERDQSGKLFVAICDRAHHLVSSGGPLSPVETRNLVYNLLDMCPNPTKTALRIAYEVALNAEASAEVNVTHRGMIQQFFAAKAGTDALLYAKIPVFVATSCRRDSGRKGVKAFLPGLPKAPAPELSFAVATVTVPGFDSSVGSLPKARWWHWFSRRKVTRFVQLQSFEVVGSDQDLYGASDLHRDQSAGRDGSSQALLFIHGYNVRFEQAIEKTAQLVAHMQFSGVPFCYCWPSRGKLREYVADTAVVPVAARRLEALLRSLVEHFGAGSVHVLAHSLGTRILFQALDLVKSCHVDAAGEPKDPRPFGEILLNAADVPSADYCERIPVAAALARRVTSYSSEHDVALVMSRTLQGAVAGLENPPIGPSRCRPVVTNPPRAFDAIDVSQVEGGGLGHGYYGGNPRVISDIGAALDGTPANTGARGYLVWMQQGDHWVYRR